MYVHICCAEQRKVLGVVPQVQSDHCYFVCLVFLLLFLVVFFVCFVLFEAGFLTGLEFVG